MTGRECQRCGTPNPTHRHHPTGRTDGRPHHPELVDYLCVLCHQAEHRVWRGASLDAPGGTGLVALIVLLLRRLAVWLGRRVDALPLETQRQLAVALDDLADRLDGAPV